MRRLILNYSFAPRRPTGLGVYAKAVLPAFDDLAAVLMAPSGFAPPDSPLARVETSDTLRSDGGSAAQIKRLTWTELRLPRLRSSSKDLVFAPHPEAPMLSCRKVIVVHDLIPLMTAGHSSRLRAFFLHYVVPLARRCELLITDSECTRADLRTLTRVPDDRIQVIPLGVDMSRFAPKAPVTKKPYFLYVGRHDRYKNAEACIRGLAAVPDRNCRLKIAGPESAVETPRLKGIAKDLGVNDRIDFLSYLSFDELIAAIQNATALVHLSSYEGFGLTLLEAMAAGTAVICSQADAVLEVARDHARVCNPANPGDVAEAMHELLTDTASRAAFERAGKKRANEYTWNRTREQLRRALTGVL